MASAAGPAELVGREPELGRVDDWLAALADGPAGLIVRGEPGIGKTSVWAAAVARARDAADVILVTRPVESELPLGYAGLGDLLSSAAEPLLDELPERLRTALEAALLLRDESEPAEPLAVARATLAVLHRLADRSPVVLAVDDVQWLDPASARALTFALRRVAESPVAVVVSLRDGHPEPLGLLDAFGPRTLELPLAGLTVGALGHLLRARVDPALPRRTVVRIHERSGGNPFFALELARAEGRTLPASLSDVVGRRLLGVPEHAMPAVELAAVLGSAPVGVFDGDALDAAVAAGVLVEQGGTVRFSHPLLAAGAYDRVPPARRRSLHERAAERSVTLEERAGHVALAADGADPEAAALLERAARAARDRGAPESAAELAAHARRLTPSGDDAQWARAMDEADYLMLAADEPSARAIVDEVLAGGVRGAVRVRALVQRALYEIDPTAAVARLEEAVRETHDDEHLAARALCELAWQRAAWLGDVEPAQAEALAGLEAAERLCDDMMLANALTTAGLVTSLAGDPRAETFFRRAFAVHVSWRRIPGGREPRVAFANQRWWCGDFPTAAALLAEARADAEREGDEGQLMRLTIFRAELELRRGHWDEAARLLEAALADARDYWRAVALVQLAFLHARRGDRQALAVADEIAESPLALGDPVIAAAAEYARGLVDLVERHVDAAAERLVRLPTVSDGGGTRAPQFAFTIPDAVAALVEAGRRADAERLVRQLERRAPQLEPWSSGGLPLCRGLLELGESTSEAALELLERARQGFEAIEAPWELAQTLLAEARALRRAGRRTDAAAALERAASIFADLRAEPWRLRALGELRLARPRPRRDDSLTAAESRVAALVAAGHTNKEVAARLFTTVATVEAHLTRIYRKLELRSRSELTRAVADGRVELDA